MGGLGVVNEDEPGAARRVPEIDGRSLITDPAQQALLRHLAERGEMRDEVKQIVSCGESDVEALAVEQDLEDG